MKKTITSLLILAILLFIPGFIHSQNKEDAKFQKILDKYFDAYWKFYPTAASIAGYHKYDNKLESFSKKNLEKRRTEIDEFNQEIVTKVLIDPLSEAYQLDRSLILDGIDLDVLNHDRILPWEYNPLFYNKILINSVKSLIENSTLEPGANAKNIADRLKNLPKFIKQAQENLKTPASLYTEKAIEQFPTILNYYKNNLTLWISNAPSSQQGNLNKYLPEVLKEMEGYGQFLKNDLLPRSTGTFMLGEAHPLLIRATLRNNLMKDELLARAKADIENLRAEMLACCLALYKIMDPKIDINNPPPSLSKAQAVNHVITHVLEKIKDNHPDKNEFLKAIQDNVSEIKKFIKDKDLVSLPAENLTIDIMPAENQGGKLFDLSIPGYYNPDGQYSLQIAPFSNSLSEDQLTSFMEEYNDFLLPFWTIRNVYPGTFVPDVKTRKNASLVKKFYPNLPLMKGWPVFLEEKMVKSGFKEYDIRVRLNQLKYMIRAAQDYQLDYNIIQSGMTEKDAVAYMRRKGFQTEAEAKRKYYEIALNPGMATYAYVGYQEMIDLQKAYKKKMGEGYSFKAFMDKLLSYGPVSFRVLKKKFSE